MPINITIYSIAHCLVDFACAFAYYACAAPNFEDWVLLALIYNFCAFGLQLPLGYWADRINYNAVFAIAGCLMAAVGCAFASHALVLAVLAGLGGALFYVGSGLEVLHDGGDRVKGMGLYLALGALGVYLGTYAGTAQPHDSTAWAMLALLTAAATIAVGQYNRSPNFRSHNPAVGEWKPSVLAIWALGLFLASVLVRSYLNLLFDFTWGNEYAFLVVLAVALGKVAGGYGADKFGLMKVATFSLLGAMVFMGWPESIWCGCLGVFLLAISAPIAVWAVAKLMPDRHGLSFGMMGAAMFFGFLPLDFYLTPLPASPAGYIISCAIILLCLYAALRLAYDIIRPIDQTPPGEIRKKMLNDQTIIA